MNRMAEPLPIPVPVSDDDEAAIAAVIHAETQAFVDADFDAWAACHVQDKRRTDMGITATTGLNVVRGWADIAAEMKHVIANDLGCGMVRFRQDNLQITVQGDLAWVVFDGWAENAEGATWETFETRVLERGSDGWRISYSSFVEHRRDYVDKDAISVDGDGRIIWASQRTLDRLKEHPVLTVSAGRVRARRLEWDKALQAAIAQASAYHGFFELRRFAEETGGPFQYPAVLGETDEDGVAVVHVSVRDNATILQFDGAESLTHRLAVAQAVFGLSDGQLKVARLIADGEGLKNVAEALGISINTARTHLARLYEKTGVSSQTALVRLLLSVG